MTEKMINRIRRLRFEDGLAVKQIAYKTGYCINTIYKYLKDDYETEKEAKLKSMDSIAAPYEDIVREWLIDDTHHYYKQRHTAKRVYDRLREMFPDFRASYKTILRLYKRIYAEIFTSKRLKRILPDCPGEVEITSTPFPCKINGHKCDSYSIIMAFPYSRASFIQVIPERSTEWILTALQKIYEHIGGIPPVHRFSPKTKLYKYRNQYVSDITDELLMRFILYYGFKDDYLVPEEEQAIRGPSHLLSGYYRQKLLSCIKEISCLHDFNKELLDKCDKLLDRAPAIDKTTTVRILFESDKAMLLPLPEVPFKIAAWFKRKVDKMAVLSLGLKHKYALSHSMKNRTVFVYLTVDKVEVRNLNHDLIQSFDRIYSTDIQDVSDPAHQLYLLRSKPNAVLNCSLKDLFPPKLIEYFASHHSRAKSYYINAMWEICTRSDIHTAISCAAEAVEKGITGRVDIIKIFEGRYE